jgi:murein DD-endopeptidase MepM/ murein hydrolase activator NlpD
LQERKASQPKPGGTDSLSGGLPNVNTLPFRDSLFRRLPIALEQITFWKYYGNNVFAYNLWRDGKQWYAYSQGLHAGLDFGNGVTRGVPVYAGLEGSFYRHDTRYTRPNGLWVKTSDYTVIYGHLANPRSFQVGQPIGVDTVMGEIEFRGQEHLHLEVRYQGRWIINPLLLMPQNMRNALIQKFPPDENHFFKSRSWSRWQKPLDQPVLVLNGGLIGPHA